MLSLLSITASVDITGLNSAKLLVTVYQNTKIYPELCGFYVHERRESLTDEDRFIMAAALQVEEGTSDNRMLKSAFQEIANRLRVRERLTLEKAREILIDKGRYIDYIDCRYIHTDFSKDKIDPTGYDSVNGLGRLKAIVDVLRAAHRTEEDDS